MSYLQEKVASAQSTISSLQEQIDKGCVEQLALKHEVWVLKNNLENHEKDVEELRAEVSHQSERYDEFWSAHGVLLEEAQTLRSQVTTLSSGGRVEITRGWLGSASRDPEGPNSWLRGSDCQSGRPTDHAERSGGWHERSRGWSEDQGSGRRQS